MNDAKLSPIEAVCEAAVERLKTRLPGKTIIDHFPNKPEEFDFEGFGAAALVLYEGDRFDGEGLAGAQGVAQTFRLTVCLLVRGLRGNEGAYGLVHETRAALHGASLAGSTGLRPVETALERESEGVFQYRLSFEGRIVAVPVKRAQVALPRGFTPERI